VPSERSCQIFADLFGQPISEGTLAAAVNVCAGALAETETRIKQGISGAPIAHFDETGRYVADEHLGTNQTLYSETEISVVWTRQVLFNYLSSFTLPALSSHGRLGQCPIPTTWKVSSFAGRQSLRLSGWHQHLQHFIAGFALGKISLA
jgi:transposase IS66 family protein